MRYWVYINDRVDGPYEEDKLASIDGFTPDTLICSEEIEEGAGQEWVKASDLFEFDEAAKTMTRAPLTQEELNYIHSAGDKNAAQSSPAADVTATQILADKIDNLTKQIEELKQKLDSALEAAVAAPRPQAKPIEQHQDTPSLQETETAPAAEKTDKPLDLLDEIQIGAEKTESLTAKGGEEVVLRSALDSLYNASAMQPEEEKEPTFQDLLSPIKPKQETETEPKPADRALDEKAQDQDPQPQQQTAQPAPEETPAVTEEKREEIINEITAPAAQNDLISQVIEETAQTQPAQLTPVDEAVQNDEKDEAEPQDAVLQQEEQSFQIPSVPAQEQAPASEHADGKESLDLTGQPQLNLVSEEPAAQSDAQPAPMPAFQQEQAPSSELTPMNPDDQPKDIAQNPETIKELVPGKKIEAQETEEDSLISQADLEEAFTERASVAQDFPFPEETQNTQSAASAEEPSTQTPAQEQPAASAAAEAAPAQPQPDSLPKGEGFYNPGDMTEVELKEGSTYLISDFIPPATASGAETKAHGAVPGSAEAAQVSAENNGVMPVPQTLTGNVEEIVPASSQPNQTDLTMSKVILENTIKTKRGATMDIKTVPMVNEPGDSERLDLSDSDLDFNTQHDIKPADAKTGGNKLTKTVLAILGAVLLLAMIYIMLAFLEILPEQFNILKKSAETTQIQQPQQNEVFNEMLGTDGTAAQNQQEAAATQMPQGNYPADGQVPVDMMQQPAAGTPPAYPAQGQLPGQNANPLAQILINAQNVRLANGQTLQQLVNSRHPAAQNQIEWTISTAVEPNNYSILAKVPPENPQGFRISYRFNYNTVTQALDPTISDSKNLLDSILPQAAQ